MYITIYEYKLEFTKALDLAIVNVIFEAYSLIYYIH